MDDFPTLKYIVILSSLLLFCGDLSSQKKLNIHHRSSVEVCCKNHERTHWTKCLDAKFSPKSDHRNTCHSPAPWRTSPKAFLCNQFGPSKTNGGHGIVSHPKKTTTRRNRFTSRGIAKPPSFGWMDLYEAARIFLEGLYYVVGGFFPPIGKICDPSNWIIGTPGLKPPLQKTHPFLCST